LAVVLRCPENLPLELTCEDPLDCTEPFVPEACALPCRLTVPLLHFALPWELPLAPLAPLKLVVVEDFPVPCPFPLAYACPEAVAPLVPVAVALPTAVTPPCLFGAAAPVALAVPLEPLCVFVCAAAFIAATLTMASAPAVKHFVKFENIVGPPWGRLQLSVAARLLVFSPAVRPSTVRTCQSRKLAVNLFYF
jgi:hypothetical protein